MRNTSLPAPPREALALLAAGVLWVGASLAPAPTLAAAPRQLAQSDTIEAPWTPLEAAAVGFSGALESAATDELARFLAADGIRLQLEGSEHAGLSRRQAVAALRSYLRGYDTARAVVSRAARVEGSEDRGFAEVSWSARAAGTSDEVRRTLFLGLHLSDDDWRVDEVRFLR